MLQCLFCLQSRILCPRYDSGLKQIRLPAFTRDKTSAVPNKSTFLGELELVQIGDLKLARLGRSRVNGKPKSTKNDVDHFGTGLV